MKKLLPPFIALFATLGLGIGVTIYLRYRHHQTNPHLSVDSESLLKRDVMRPGSTGNNKMLS